MYFPGQSIPLHFPQDREGAYILLVTRKGSLSLILINLLYTSPHPFNHSYTGSR